MLPGPGTSGTPLLQLTPGDWTVILVLLVIGLAVKGLILWWLYEDIKARGEDPTWWIVAGVPFDIPTLIVWLIRRPPAPNVATAHGAPDEPTTPVQDPLQQEQAKTIQRPGPTHDPPVQPHKTASETSGRATESSSPPASNRTVTCPHCTTRFQVERQIGPQRVQCPRCHATGTIE